MGRGVVSFSTAAGTATVTMASGTGSLVSSYREVGEVAAVGIGRPFFMQRVRFH